MKLEVPFAVTNTYHERRHVKSMFPISELLVEPASKSNRNKPRNHLDRPLNEMLV